MILIDAAQLDVALAIDGEDFDLGEPVDGETMQPRKQTVAATADVATSANGVTGACRDGYAMPLL